MGKYEQIFAKFGRTNILVVGDIILDQYIHGCVSRMSPEAPVPVVLEQESFYTPGGAANVAQNLTGLGANVTFVGRVGNDTEGKILKKRLNQIGVNIHGIFTDKKLPTICKTRVIAQHQQVVRIDREKTHIPGSKAVNDKITAFKI